MSSAKTDVGFVVHANDVNTYPLVSIANYRFKGDIRDFGLLHFHQVELGSLVFDSRWELLLAELTFERLPEV
jgi:hypothetical protein